MNILHLCNKVPFPGRDGSSIAMESLINLEVLAGHTVHVVALNTNKHKVTKPTSSIASVNFDFFEIFGLANPGGGIIPEWFFRIGAKVYKPWARSRADPTLDSNSNHQLTEEYHTLRKMFPDFPNLICLTLFSI